MARPTSRPQSASPDSTPEEIANITAEEWMLVRLREELYGGRWDEMRRDLQSRLRGEPYIFKLAGRIQEDLARIEVLSGIETRMGRDLKTYMPPLT